MAMPFEYCIGFDPFGWTNTLSDTLFGHLRSDAGGPSPDSWGSCASYLNPGNLSMIEALRGDVPSTWKVSPRYSMNKHLYLLNTLQFTMARQYAMYSPTIWDPQLKTVVTLNPSSPNAWITNAPGRDILNKNFWAEVARNWSKFKSAYFDDTDIEIEMMDSFEAHWYDVATNEDLSPSKHTYWNHTNGSFNANIRNLMFPFRALSNADDLYVEHHRGGWFAIDYLTTGDLQAATSVLPLFSGTGGYCGGGGQVFITGSTVTNRRVDYGIATWTIPIIGDNGPSTQFGIGSGIGVNIESSGDLSTASSLRFSLYVVNLEEDISLGDLLFPSSGNQYKIRQLSTASSNSFSGFSSVSSNVLAQFSSLSVSPPYSGYTHFMFVLHPGSILSSTDSTYRERKVTATVPFIAPSSGTRSNYVGRMTIHGQHDTLSDWPLSYRASLSEPNQPMVFSDWSDPANWNWES